MQPLRQGSNFQAVGCIKLKTASVVTFGLARPSNCFSNTGWKHGQIPVRLYVQVTVHRDNLRINNQQDASNLL